jgi:hypothetical protein
VFLPSFLLFVVLDALWISVIAGAFYNVSPAL